MTASENAIFSSVATFTLHTPSSMVRRTYSSGTSLAPCSTSGISTTSRISPRRLKSIFGVLVYRPCAVPIATARLSTPVSSTKRLASCGSVRNALSASTLMSSSTPPSRPSSASTLQSLRWQKSTTDFTSFTFCSNGKWLPSIIALRTPALTLRRISSRDSW
ncbi:hypothetical protein D3C86_1713220 [compost metagenome]